MNVRRSSPPIDEVARRERAAQTLVEARQHLKWKGVRLPHAPPDKSEIVYLSASNVTIWSDLGAGVFTAPRPAPRPYVMSPDAASMSALDEIKHLAEKLRQRAQLERVNDEEDS